MMSTIQTAPDEQIERYEACIAEMVRDIQRLQQKLDDCAATPQPSATRAWRHIHLRSGSTQARCFRFQGIDFVNRTVTLSPKSVLQPDSEIKYGTQIECGVVNVLEVCEGDSADGERLVLVETLSVASERFRYSVVLAGGPRK
ncbi:MAG: hypothetical protein JWP36_53 [Paucimonas sp.]|nr:hypothetical protein [Paucimonas sp.]